MEAPPAGQSSPEHSPDYINPKFSLDISLLLATVIAGAAVVEALRKFCFHCPPLSFKLPLFCQAGTVILTTLRFFNGNVNWNYLNYRGSNLESDLSLLQRVFQRLSSYYLHILQYVLFFLAAQCVGMARDLLIMMMIISVLDVFWTFGGWMYTSDKRLKRALGSWCILNFISAGVCLLYYYAFLDKPWLPLNFTSYLLFVVYVGTGTADYLWNAELFFGYFDEKHLMNRGGQDGKQDRDQ